MIYETFWECPSNIALIKYWGKYGVQLPRNPSLSFTLSESNTQTRLRFEQKGVGNDFTSEFFLDGAPNEKFKAKTDAFIRAFLNDFAFLRGGHLSIETRNSFPHSAGIASSASGMCALVAGLTDLREQVSGIKLSPEAFRREVSFFSRLASGSACRSVYPRLASWGVVENLENSSEEYASERACHVIFHDYRDSILIVSADEKAVSSRAGHALMENNPFADTRYALARKNFDELYSAMQTADLETFVRVTENEALMLHALMMLSEPSFILMKPATLAVIEAVLNFRASEKIPVCFTLDAGPNVHLLYPAQNEEKVKAWIERDLLQYCAGGRVIHDQVGLGAKKMPV